MTPDQRTVPLPGHTRLGAVLAGHPRAVDLALAALTLVPVFLRCVVDPPPEWPLLIAVCLAAAGALLGRRRAPGRTLVVIAGLTTLVVLTSDTPGAHLQPAAALAVGTLASRRATGTAVAGYFLVTLLPGLTVGLRQVCGRLLGDDSVPLSGVAGIGPVDSLMLIAFVIGVILRGRRTRREARAEQFRQRLDRERRRERERIAAEMHDVVGHSLTVMIALAGGAAAGWRRDPERAELALRHLAEVGDTALVELQRSLSVLREEASPAGEAPATAAGDPRPERLLEAFRAAGLPAELRWDGPELPGDPSLALIVSRVAEEGLTNALRYADRPNRVVLTVAVAPDQVRVSVSDDGRGASSADRAPSRGSGSGIASLRSRVESFGGTFSAGPCSPGWKLAATLPVGVGP